MPLFRVGTFRYEAVRKLAVMPSGEVLLLAHRFAMDEPHPGLCLVRRLPNPSTFMGRKRLAEEIQLAFLLHHPSIAQVHLAKIHLRRVHVVMEYVDGPSVDTLVSAAVVRGKPVSEAFALYVGAELADALHHAHSLKGDGGKPLGIIHRDVNPRNVFVGPHGEVKLSNFGAAYSLVIGREESPASLVRGDVAYSSPEYLERVPLTPRSDVFSLGVLLTELLTGRHLFALDVAVRAPQGVTPLRTEYTPSLPLEQMRVLLSSFGPDDVEQAVGAVAPDIRALLHTALRVAPGERFATAADMGEALRAALTKRHPGYGRHEAAAEAARVVAEGGCARDQVEFGESGLYPEGLDEHELKALAKVTPASS
ncbi:serine/threonine-protein kinase [Myxococcus llanfairpwllgwyngyllgogerychwyrndrobwllllantysiliogogogochensis]|nr:serine/threonine-protein kinase [Myxococcus llanfairpwllgwyngyllgogerychwyrndrobwllllantysiliogogogochensis]